MQGLVNRFKEFRRTPKPALANVKTPIKCVKKPTACSPGLTISEPVVPPGEDNVSFERHNKEIKSHFHRNGRRNLVVLKELIKTSFAMRRKDILENNYHVKTILQKYPFFKEPSQVMEVN